MAETSPKATPKKVASKPAAVAKPAATTKAVKPVATAKVAAATKPVAVAKPVVAAKSVAAEKPAAAAKPAAIKKPAATKVKAEKPAAKSAGKEILLSDEQRYRMVSEAAYYRAESNQFKSDPLRDWIDAESDIAALINGNK